MVESFAEGISTEVGWGMCEWEEGNEFVNKRRKNRKVITKEEG